MEAGGPIFSDLAPVVLTTIGDELLRNGMATGVGVCPLELIMDHEVQLPPTHLPHGQNQVP